MNRSLIVLVALVACTSEAREDMKQAGQELEQAAEKTVDQLDDRAEVAGKELSAELDEARKKLEAAKDVADRAGDLYIDPGQAEEVRATSVRCAAEEYAVDRSMVKQAIDNPLALAGTTTFEAVAGKGYRLTSVDQESPVAKLDVRVGDIVVAVDGTKVDALDGENLVRRLNSASEIEFTVERDGEDVVKTVAFES